MDVLRRKKLFLLVYLLLFTCYYACEKPRSRATILHICTCRVGRVVSFSPVVGIGTPPTPHPQAGMPLWFLGEGHTRWRERGWESSNSDEGTYTVVLCKYMYFVYVPIRQ
jgi:hypothetical protein